MIMYFETNPITRLIQDQKNIWFIEYYCIIYFLTSSILSKHNKKWRDGVIQFLLNDKCILNNSFLSQVMKLSQVPFSALLVLTSYFLLNLIIRAVGGLNCF